MWPRTPRRSWGAGPDGIAARGKPERFSEKKMVKYKDCDIKFFARTYKECPIITHI